VSSGSIMDKSVSSKSNRKKQMGRLHKTGHIDDAASLFEDFVDI